MSKVLNFPTPAPVEIINEAHFEKFDEAALLLMCFEVAADVVEAVSEGEGITERDCSHVGLMEVCMALAVMFRRRTGHEVQQVSADHLDHQRKCLMEGLSPNPCLFPFGVQRSARYQPQHSQPFRLQIWLRSDSTTSIDRMSTSRVTARNSLSWISPARTRLTPWGRLLS